MPSDEFWKGEPHFFYSYIEAYRQNKSRTDEAEAFNTDYQAWLIGLYVQQAVGTLLNSAFGKRGTKKSEYPSEPVSFTRRKKEDIKKKEEMELAQLQREFAGFRRFVDAMNTNLR